MIFPSNRVRIFVATDLVDFRKGHNGLAALVQNHLHKDPFTGTVYVFRSKRAGRLKLLYWDGSGLVMAYKRMEDHALTGRACLHARKVVQMVPLPSHRCTAAMRGGHIQWHDAVEPCAVRGAVCWFGLAQSPRIGSSPTGCGRVNHRGV